MGLNERSRTTSRDSIEIYLCSSQCDLRQCTKSKTDAISLSDNLKKIRSLLSSDDIQKSETSETLKALVANGFKIQYQIPSSIYTYIEDKNDFNPSNNGEEAALVYLIAESKGCTTIQDSLASIYVKHGCHTQAIQSMERQLKEKARNPLSWFQLGLTCIIGKKFAQALLAFNEADALLMQGTPYTEGTITRNLPSLMAAKVCFQHTHNILEGVNYALKALNISQSPDDVVASYYILGIGYFLLARNANTHAERRYYQEDSLNMFDKATKINAPYKIDLLTDRDFFFYYALINAEARQISTAITLVKQALACDPSHSKSWNLLALLLTSGKQYKKALKAVKLGLEKFPSDLEMMSTKAAIESVLDTPAAIKTFDKLVEEIDKSFENKDWNEWEKIEKNENNEREKFDEGDSDSGGEDDEEHPHTDSDPHPFNTKGHNLALLKVSVYALCNYAKLCSKLKNFTSAHDYLVKAKRFALMSGSNNLSATVACHMGVYHEMQDNIDEAESQYHIALAVHDNHVRSLTRLGSLFFTAATKTEDKLKRAQSLDKAYGYLLNAIRVDSTSHQAWYHFGVTLEALGHSEKAANAFLTSIEWENTAPLRNYQEIAISF